MRRCLIGTAILLALVGAGGVSAAHPGASGRLLFLRTGGGSGLDSNPNEVWSANPDGSRLSRLTVAGVDSARWSPDGASIAYATDCGNRYDNHCGVLRTMRADGSGKHTIDQPIDPADNGIGRDRSPTWSPDGKRIAFERAWPLPDSLWVVDAGGGGATELIARTATDPAWSPDGKRIAFSSGTTLATAAIDGSDERMLVSSARANAATPDWSPDGASIAFTELRRGVAWVCVVPAAGGSVRCVARGGEAVWSPDGTELAFVHAHDIWTVRADGTRLRNVTRTPRRWETSPDWQPR